MRPAGLKSAEELAEKYPHGTRMRYLGGCKCMECRAANSRYSVARDHAVRNGEWDGLVPAMPARRHMRRLSRGGVGYKSIAAAASVSKSVAFKIFSGRRSAIRKSTERRILAVDREAVADAAVIDAKKTWTQIERLRQEGFTLSELARRLGYKNAAIQFRERILARNAAKVDRFYRLHFKGVRKDAGR